jgi:opacity protein-like surface antigen
MLAPRPAWAAAGRRVVVARPANADAVTVEALARVRGELEAAGFEIVTIPVDPAQDQRTTVESIGRDENPVAAFAIFPGPRSGSGQSTAEIWVSDRQKGKATVQRMRVDPQDADRSAAVLAVYAVELLKASLADLWVPEARRKPEPEAPPPPPPPPPDVEAPAGRPYRFAGFGFELAGGVLAHAGGLDSTWTPVLRVSFGGASGLAVRLGVAAGGQRSSVANTAGSARLSHQLATVEAVYAFRPNARLQPFVAAGAGAYRIGVSGTSVDENEWLGRSTQLWTAAMTAAAGVTVALGQHMAVIVGAEALLFLPRPVIELGEADDARVGQAGRPAVLLTAGLLASR